MTKPDWQEVKQIFNAAVDLPSVERTAYLRDACGPNIHLKREVESLLASHDDSEG
ncbi:MAG: hypothetical protein JO299_11705, partial [Gammaproteobacteria bacterium]|nr:hypothetical protein [Gammaproteobacteria bacterium]